MKIIHLADHDPVYRRDLTVLIGKQTDAWEYLSTQEGMEEPLDPTDKALFIHCGSKAWIWVPHLKGPSGIGLLAHEAVHASWWALQYAGIPTSADTEEAYAYYLEFIVRTVLENK